MLNYYCIPEFSQGNERIVKAN
ncbi:MAG: hypothetical protein JWR67_3207, partial [Mucilaginibacter sp.]|nr:hypothetical protein [Mucilaginibacter sp.]